MLTTTSLPSASSQSSLVWRVAGDVDADLGHRLYRHRVDPLARFGAGGAHPYPVSGQVPDPAGSDLRAAGVVDTHEQQEGLRVVDVSVTRARTWAPMSSRITRTSAGARTATSSNGWPIT